MAATFLETERAALCAAAVSLTVNRSSFLDVTQDLRRTPMVGISPLPKQMNTRGSRSEDKPTAGAVHRHGQWLEQAVSLDLLAWLDPLQGDRDGRISTRVHRQILAVCRRLKAISPSTPASRRGLHRDMQIFRSHLVLAINRVSEDIPRTALSALRSAEQANVRYESEGPFGPDGEWTTTDFAFGDVVFGKPELALEAMVELRKHTLEEQGQAVQVLAAMSADRQSAHSMFNEAVPKQVRDRWVRQSSTRLSKSTALVDVALQPLMDAIWRGMQCGSGVAPLAIALPGNASDDDLLQAAEGYRVLRWCLQEDLVQRPVGDDLECRRARRAWTAYCDCAMACQVIASWLSALGATGPGARCEFCYRHRVTRRRCREHTVPESVTPEARMGQVLAKPFVLRVQVLTSVPEIRIALAADRAPHALDLSAMLVQAQLAQVPVTLQHQAAVLASQLRTLWPVLGSRLAHEVEMLFAAMVNAVKACHGETGAKSLRQEASFRAQRRRSAELLTLSGFLRLWWGTGMPITSFKLVGRGHDPAHPHMRSGVIDSSVAHAFLRQRAWLEVGHELVTSTTVDLDRVIALQADGKSLRQMAMLLGCSHEKIRKLLKGTIGRRRKRAVLSPYLEGNLGL